MRDFTRFGKKIIGVARNYRSHADESGRPVPTHPLFFLKPSTSYVVSPNPIRLPLEILVEYELELGVVIGKKGKNIKKERAFEYIDGYCLGLDLTARELQNEAISKGTPWTLAKGYDTFCPVSSFIPKGAIDDPHDLSIWLKINGDVRQKGHTSDMIFKIPDLIEAISSVMKLEDGDLILTGTPSGTGPLKIGDILTAGIGHDLIQMQFRTVARPASDI